VNTSWTDEQRRDYVAARDWARHQLVPWAAADTFATWFATVGRNLFDVDDQLEDAYEWWAAEHPDGAA